MAASGNYCEESGVDNWLTVIAATEDFATSAVDISTEKITVTNDIATCTEIQFSSTGEVPTPLVTGTIYYAIRVDATYVKVATTPILAAAGTAINLTDVGSGIHTLDIGSGSSESDRQEVIDRAEQLIERITRDYFYAKDFAVYRNGNDNDQLFLGLVPDIISVTEVLISGVALTTSWYTNDVNSVYLDPEAETLSAGDMAELHLRLKYKRRLFPEGMGNIKITGTMGHINTPVAIKKAAIILCRAENSETLYTRYDDFQQEKLGDYSYNRGSKRYLTGIMEADQLIRNYIRRKPMLSAF